MMNPDEVLEELRVEVDATPNRGVIAAFVALDAWLSAGGDLPVDWQR